MMPVGYLVCPGTELGHSGWYYNEEGHQHLYHVDNDQEPEVWTLGTGPFLSTCLHRLDRGVAVCQLKNGK